MGRFDEVVFVARFAFTAKAGRVLAVVMTERVAFGASRVDHPRTRIGLTFFERVEQDGHAGIGVLTASFERRLLLLEPGHLALRRLELCLQSRRIRRA